MVKNCSWLLLVICCVAAPARAGAQDWPDAVVPGPLAGVAGSAAPVRYTPGAGAPQTIVAPAADVRVARGGVLDFARTVEVSRPKALKPLYISMATLQGLDAVSTWQALAAGGREANPLMAPLVGSPATFLTLKAGVAGSMIYATERLWKRNRKAAVLLLIGTNVGYAAVVSHNFAIAR